MIGQYFTAKAQTSIAQLQTTQALAADQLDLSRATLVATSVKFKEVLVLIWFIPFILTIIDPARSAFIFSNMHAMPEFYLQSCVTVFYTLLGITVAAPFMGSMFTSLASFVAQNQEFKLNKAQIDKSSFYEALRHLKGTVSQADVNTLDPVLDEVNKAK